MSTILGDASGKMHHGILFDRRLFNVICSKKMVLLSSEDRNSETLYWVLPACPILDIFSTLKQRAAVCFNLNTIRFLQNCSMTDGVLKIQLTPDNSNPR